MLAHYAPALGVTDLKRFANRVVNAADPDGPEPIDDQLQRDRRYLELKQRLDGMWHLNGKLTSTVGAQLNAILDPLAKPRSSSINNEQGQTVKIPDGRPSVQRLHDALDEMCGRLLKSGDRPSAGGVPASVIVTVSLEDLLAKAGLAETADGTQLTSEQLLRIADEAEIWPTIINHNNIPLALGRSQRLASTGQTMALITRDGGCSFPGCDHPPAWCDRHHILDWISGGRTDLDKSQLPYAYHMTYGDRRQDHDGARVLAGIDGSLRSAAQHRRTAQRESAGRGRLRRDLGRAVRGQVDLCQQIQPEGQGRLPPTAR